MTQIVGRRLGRYEVQQEIGRGGMARVYRALDTLLQRPVAIKVMAPQLELDPEFADRFEREAIMAANLRHPAIVTVYDVGDQDGLRYLAMEFIRGCTLHAILSERGALGLGYAVTLLEPVARALDFAHSQGAVHRDVKPHNIMVDVDGRVLLTDFGIAQAPETENSQRLTRTGVFMGTPEYISPEQAQARRVDGRSDLYSLGIVAYEIITGRVPFSGATPNLLVAHTQTPPPPATSVVSNLPQEVDAVLARALAKDPQARFATGTAMVEALRIVARRNGVALATNQQIADLATPLDTPEAQHPVALDRSVPSSPPRRPVTAVPVPTLPPPGDPTIVAPPKQQPSHPQPVVPPPLDAPNTASSNNGDVVRRLLMVGAPLLAVLLLGLLLVFFNGRVIGIGSQPTSPPTPSLGVPPTIDKLPAGGGTGGAVTSTTAPTSAATEPPRAEPSPSVPGASPTTPIETPTVVVPSSTLAATATITPTVRVSTPTRPRPTRTATPAAPTETPVLFTNTPVPPATDTPAPPPTDTPAPPPTDTPAPPPTNTPVLPTNTPQPTELPTVVVNQSGVHIQLPNICQGFVCS